MTQNKALEALERMRSRQSLLPQLMQSMHWVDYQIVNEALAPKNEHIDLLGIALGDILYLANKANNIDRFKDTIQLIEEAIKEKSNV